ncbi:hypothetical protein CMUS01_13823 [Colletotrichum musicola]|uniref:F-box domain-containing protein n=1 Tax=Colletotrichum musicola TaxID=2175873 RepID=A0A8H6JA29_9PEZI|nr:hypothetical protein CMUS01_13823 [Colletotrichum musicola]
MDFKNKEVQRRIAKLQPLLDEVSDCDVTISFPIGGGRVSWSRLANTPLEDASAITKANATFRFLDLPQELRDEVVGLLTRKALISFSSTCRDLRTKLEPAVFSSICIHGEGSNFYDRLDSLSLSIKMPPHCQASGSNYPWELSSSLIRNLEAFNFVIAQVISRSSSSLEFLELDLEWESFSVTEFNFYIERVGVSSLRLKRLRSLRLSAVHDESLGRLYGRLLDISPNLEAVQMFTYISPSRPPFYRPPPNLHMKSLIVGHPLERYQTSDVLDFLKSLPRLENLALIGRWRMVDDLRVLDHMDEVINAVRAEGKHLRRLSLPLDVCYINADEVGFPATAPLSKSWYFLVRRLFSAVPALDLVQLPSAHYREGLFEAKRTSDVVLKLEELAEDEGYDTGLTIEKVPSEDALLVSTLVAAVRDRCQRPSLLPLLRNISAWLVRKLSADGYLELLVRAGGHEPGWAWLRITSRRPGPGPGRAGHPGKGKGTRGRFPWRYLFGLLQRAGAAGDAKGYAPRRGGNGGDGMEECLHLLAHQHIVLVLGARLTTLVMSSTGELSASGRHLDLEPNGKVAVALWAERGRPLTPQTPAMPPPTGVRCSACHACDLEVDFKGDVLASCLQSIHDVGRRTMWGVSEANNVRLASSHCTKLWRPPSKSTRRESRLSATIGKLKGIDATSCLRWLALDTTTG